MKSPEEARHDDELARIKAAKTRKASKAKARRAVKRLLVLTPPSAAENKAAAIADAKARGDHSLAKDLAEDSE